MSQPPTGWQLAKQSWAVLRANKKLIVLPSMSTILCLILIVIALRPLRHWEIANWQHYQTHHGSFVIALALIFIATWFCNLIVITCNAALIAAANDYLTKKSVTFTQAFARVISCLPQVILWSIFSSTVGLLLRLLQVFIKRIGAFAELFSQIGWGVISYFVVPVLVLEKLGPIASIKRASRLLRDTWGPSLFSNLSLGASFLLLRLLSLVPAGIGLYLGGTRNVIIGVAITVGLSLIINLFSSALHHILQCALYRYANEGNAGEPFQNNTMEKAFSSYRRKRR